MLRKVRELVAILLLRLALLVMPQRTQVSDEEKIIGIIKDVRQYLEAKPGVLELATSRKPVSLPQRVGVIEKPVAGAQYELKVVDPFEEEISKAIIEALKDEQENGPIIMGELDED